VSRILLVIASTSLAFGTACHNVCNPSAGQTCQTGYICSLRSECVTPSYSIDEDAGTVTDLVTGLVWQRDTPSNPCPMDGGMPTPLCLEGSAASYCASLDAGTTVPGWQLPTLPQLWSIVEASGNPTIDSAAFPNTAEQPYWTSQPAAGGAGNNWVVFFGGGYSASLADDNLSAIRCVLTPDAG
jgi:hypothetical protein